VDEHGVAMRSHWDKLWECAWDEKNPQDAPHVAVECARKKIE
jgi:hypothetical protein